MLFELIGRYTFILEFFSQFKRVKIYPKIKIKRGGPLKFFGKYDDYTLLL